MSKQIERIRNKSGVFSGMTPADPVAVTAPTEPVPVPKAKKDKTAFSVWVDVETLETWKRYCTLTETKSVDLCTRAITDYIERHPVTDEQKAAFITKMGL